MIEKKHLPIFGIGPIYGISIIGITILGILLSKTSVINNATLDVLHLPFTVIGIIFIIIAIITFIKAQIDMGNCIKENHLVTNGIYSCCRNPLYTAVMYICIGIDYISNNLLLMLFPFIYWVLMTVLVSKTEERWLKNMYGQEYIDYCKRVNRCILWFPRKK